MPAAHSHLPAGRFEHRHDLLHLIRVIEHPPRGPQAFSLPDAEKIPGVVAQLTARLVQLLLFFGAEAELVVFIE